MRIVQSAEDTVFIPKGTNAFVGASCKTGNKLRFGKVPEGTHTSIGEQSISVTARWLEDRFAGKLIPSACDGPG